ncbi:uncharacterized protein LOC132695783 [Cylas formicarius]|uniref:uncharacterized protein LOC132695783 n=1 Tax=Cylas formicarius TaxID=197179 RepID=UPI0029587EB3|nr:uncharacterized protein LOC132695783 [Cylas formicarius]
MGSTNIQILVKARPLIERELSQKLKPMWRIQNNSISQINDAEDCIGETYSFDHISNEEQTNEDIYKLVVKPLVHSCLEGINSTILAYGQTSSGKTHVMMGDRSAPGVISLTVNDILEYIDSDPAKIYLLRCSYLEIYNEKIRDLLDSQVKEVKIREDIQGIHVAVKEEIVRDVGDIMALVKKGMKTRKIGCTNMNEHSSRSHTILKLIIQAHLKDCEGLITESSLSLVDLAGSERVGQMNMKGKMHSEGISINKSLTTLGLVIRKLSDNEQYINYRDSKLTRLLQQSLGGNSKTLIICTITTAAVEETKSTLEFAQRAKFVKNQPIVNQKINSKDQERVYEHLMNEYEKAIDKLRHEMIDKEQTISSLKGKIKSIKSFTSKVQQGDPKKGATQGFLLRRHTLANCQVLSPIEESDDSSEDTKMSQLDTATSLKSFDVDLPERIADAFTQTSPLPLRNSTEVLTSPSVLQQRILLLENSYQSLIDFTRLERQFLEDYETDDLDLIDPLRFSNLQLTEFLSRYKDSNSDVLNSLRLLKNILEKDDYARNSLPRIIEEDLGIAELSSGLANECIGSPENKDDDGTISTQKELSVKHNEMQQLELSPLERGINKSPASLGTDNLLYLRDGYRELKSQAQSTYSLGEQEVETLKKKISNLEQTQSEKDEELERFGTYCCSLEQKIDELEEFTQQLSAENHRLQEITKVHDSHVTISTQINMESEDKKVEEWTRKYFILNAEHEKVSQQVATMEVEKQEIIQLLNYIKQENANLNNENKKLLEQVKKRDTKRFEINSEHQKLSEINKQSEKIELTQQLQSMKQENSDLTIENQKLQEQTDAEHEQLLQVNKQIREIELEKIEMMRRMQSIQQENSDFNIQNQNLKEEINKLQEKISEQATLELENLQLENLNIVNQQLQEQVHTRDAKYLEMNVEHEKLLKVNNQIKEMELEKIEVTQRLQSIKQENSDFNIENQKLKEQEKVSNESTIEFKELEITQQWNCLRKENDNLNIEKQKLQKQLEKQMKKMQLEKIEFIQELQSVKHEKMLQVNKQIEEMELQKIELAQQLQSITQENSDFNVENQKLKEEVNKLQEKVSKQATIELEKPELTQQLNCIKKESENLNIENQKLQKQVNAEHEKLLQVNKQIKEMELEKIELTQRLQSIKQENSDFNIENQKLKEQVKKLQEKVSNEATIELKELEITQQLNCLKKENDNLNIENQKLQKQLEKQMKKMQLEKIEFMQELSIKHEKMLQVNKQIEEMELQKIELAQQLQSITQENSDFNVENQKLKEEVNKLQEKVSKQATIELEKPELTQQLNCIKRENENLNVENQKLQEQVKKQMAKMQLEKMKFTQELQSIKKQNSGANIENQKLQKQVNAEHEKLLQVNKQIKEMELEKIELTQRLQSIKQENSDFNIENQKLKEQVKKLQEKVSNEATIELKELEITQQLNCLKKENDNLNIENQKLQKQLEKQMKKMQLEKIEFMQELQSIKHEKMLQVNKQIEEMELQKIELAQQLQSITQENSYFNVENQKLKEEVNKLQEKVSKQATIELEKPELTQQLNCIKKENENLNIENQKLQEQVKKQMAKMQLEKMKFTQELQSIKKQNSGANIENQKLQKQVNDEHKKLINANKQIKEMEFEKIELTQRLQSIKQENSDFNIENQKLKEQVKKLQEKVSNEASNELKELEITQQLNCLKKENDNLNIENQKLRKQLENQMEKIKLEKIELMQELQSIKHEKMLQVNKQIEEMEYKKIELTQQLQSITQENSDFNVENQKLKEEVNKLQEKVSKQATIELEKPELTQQLNCIKKENENLNIENQKLQEQVKKQMAKMQLEKMKFTQELQSVKKQNSDANIENQKLQKQLNAEHEKLLQANKQIKEIELEKIEMTRQLQSIKQGNIELEKSELMQHLNYLKKENENLNIENQKMQEQVKNQMEKIQFEKIKFIQELKAMTQENEHLKIEMNQLFKTISKTKADLQVEKDLFKQKHDKELSKLTQELNSILHTKNNLESDNRKLIQELELLKKEFTGRKKSLEMRKHEEKINDKHKGKMTSPVDHRKQKRHSLHDLNRALPEECVLNSVCSQCQPILGTLIEQHRKKDSIKQEIISDLENKLRNCKGTFTVSSLGRELEDNELSNENIGPRNTVKMSDCKLERFKTQAQKRDASCQVTLIDANKYEFAKSLADLRRIQGNYLRKQLNLPKDCPIVVPGTSSKN